MASAIHKIEPGKTKVSIVIPAYNEQEYILFVLKKVLAVPMERPIEILVVDDGSEDATPDLVQGFMKKNPEQPIFYFRQENQGKGGAVKTGIQNSTGDIVLIQDADLEYDPQDYLKLLPIIDQGAQVVYGSRNEDRVHNEHSSWMFYVGGLLVTWVTNLLYGSKLTDEATCYKVFRKEVIEKAEFFEKDFAWEPEITAKILKLGISIEEVPVSYYPRSKSQGKKISWRDGVKAIWVLLREYYRK